MDTSGGGWERVVNFVASTTVPVCPFSLTPHPHQGTFLCSNGGGVAMGVVRAAGETFSEVRASLSAFVEGDFTGFLRNPSMGQPSFGMDGHFLDGISILLREDSSPYLRHVHSFVVGNYENINDVFMKTATCPGYGGSSPNSVIGQHYSCAVVKSDNQLSGSQPLPVWDMSDAYCASDQRMCTRSSDWFYRRLARQYKSDSTEIVLQVMSQSPAHIALYHLTIYIR